MVVDALKDAANAHADRHSFWRTTDDVAHNPDPLIEVDHRHNVRNLLSKNGMI